MIDKFIPGKLYRYICHGCRNELVLVLGVRLSAPTFQDCNVLLGSGVVKKWLLWFVDWESV